MRRLFSHQQKRHMYVVNGGLCQRCGGDLGEGWDAHHVLIRGEVAGAGEHGGKREQGCNASLNTGTATHVLRRLKRDNPELAEQVVAGALSAHAAAVAAGFRKPTWTAPADPERLAEAIERRFPSYRLIKVD